MNLDFSKAFDKVETGVLLHKLRDGKVLGKVGRWLAAFLDSTHSRGEDLRTFFCHQWGSLYGTVLGPVLFLLHISDIAKDVSEATNTTSYVDDTRVSRRISDKQADCSAMQGDLSIIYNWASEVNMGFNSDKFECLRFWPLGQKPET